MRKLLPSLLFAVAFGTARPPGFAWGREGHEVIAAIAEHYMTGPEQPAQLEGTMPPR